MRRSWSRYLSTFSITARCPRTGDLGIAVSTCEPCVGWIVPFVRAGAGAIASQARSNPYFGIDGLDLLTAGYTAQAALDSMLGHDAVKDREQRQLAIVDHQGGTAVYTGPHCQPWAGHRTGDGVVVAGNLLVGEETVDAMFGHYQERSDDDLGERLVAALEAGQAAGGDRRGRISAALLVARDGAWPWIDVRVDSHPDPVVELRRVFEEFKRVHLDPANVDMITPPIVYPLPQGGRCAPGGKRGAAALEGGEGTETDSLIRPPFPPQAAQRPPPSAQRPS